DLHGHVLVGEAQLVGDPEHAKGAGPGDAVNAQHRLSSPGPWATGRLSVLSVRSPHEPTGPREARPDDRLSDMRDRPGFPRYRFAHPGYSRLPIEGGFETRPYKARGQRCLMKVPSRSSATALCSSACVFITIGPCQATGSSIGLPETRRKRMPSSPAC